MNYPTYIELPFTADHNAPMGADNCDQYPESLVRYFLENYTKEGDSIFDPFLGFGTTAFVAEDMARVPYGVEADGERFEWAAGQLENWRNIKHGDAADIGVYDFPQMDFCVTSPPYMLCEDTWNPLYGGDPDYEGYNVYLARMALIFKEIDKVMKNGSLVIVQADNIQGQRYTPLVHDLYQQISKSLTPQAEIIVRWTGAKSIHHRDYELTHCLVFKKICDA